ncbi:hypothetical protein AGMMS50262_00890 [Bacteroidia bacterium]|nr:hypothetical protein AGMMS50262_00890 [Bacteroidia bacterium]
MQTKDDIRNHLEKRLKQEHAFWSFEKSSCQNLSDWNLIKYSLIHLDLNDINYLFQIFPKKFIKQVWLEELVPQGDFLISMNLCFALLYFGAKNPRQYVKSMETRQLNKRYERSIG